MADDTTQGSGGEIVVGVDGSTAAEAAVRYAAREADRVGAELRLLHVIPTVALGTLQGPVDSILGDKRSPRLQRRRDEMLGNAADLARAVLPHDRITVDMVTGERVRVLLSAGEEARAIVLGAPWHPPVDRLITGSVVGGVAARASVPLISVPEDWTSASERGRVVVAVKDPEHPWSEQLVRRALEVAAIRKCRLTVLHSWEFPVVYDNMIATTLEEGDWSFVKRGCLEELVRLARGPYAEVAVDYAVSHGQGAHTVVAASASADLLVITRRRHAFPFGHLGAPGRTILRESRCPVEVVPPAGPDGSAEPRTTSAQEGPDR